MKRLSTLRLPATLAAALVLGLLATPAAWAEDIAGGTIHLDGTASDRSGSSAGGGKGSGYFDPGGGFDRATDAVSKPLEGAPNTVADNAGFGEGFDATMKTV